LSLHLVINLTVFYIDICSFSASKMLEQKQLFSSSLVLSRAVSELLAIFVDRRWRHIDLSARWRRGFYLMADSDSLTPTSYLRLIVTFAVSSTVSELLTIFVDRKLRHIDFSARWRRG